MIFPHGLKVLTLIIGLSCSGFIYAAPASDADIDRLVKLSELDSLFEQGLKDLQPYFDQESEQLVIHLANSTDLDAKQLAIAQQLSQAMSNATENALKDPSVIEKIKQTLKSTYSDKEVAAYNAFLSTPEGQSINRKSSTVTLEIQKFMSEIIEKNNQNKDFDQQIEKIIAPLLEQ